MIQDVLNRVEERLEALGMSAQAASIAAGLSKDAIRNMRRAANKGDRSGVSTKTINALAKALETTPGWLMTGDGSPNDTVTPSANAIVMVPVVGYVEAGVWREADHFESMDLGELPFPTNGTDPNALYVLNVNGTSANQIAPEGSSVVCASLDAVEPRDGDLVHVQRERAGLYESTLKRVHRTEAGLELRTASTDPKWLRPDGSQTVIQIDDQGSETEARIMGVVVYEIRKLRD